MKCPKCGREHEFKTKSGCCLHCDPDVNLLDMWNRLNQASRKVKRELFLKRLLKVAPFILLGFVFHIVWIGCVIYLFWPQIQPWLERIFEKYDSSSTSSSTASQSSANFEDSADSKEEPRSKFIFTGGDGNLYESGGVFCDWAGDIVEWGRPFTDSKGYRVEWGKPFYDGKGYYVEWGDPFYDADGNYIAP